MHTLWKYKKGTDLSRLDEFLLGFFCDTPACPSCGEMFVDNKISYLGVWGSENDPQVIYRLCIECGETIKSAPYFDLIKMERIIENYLKITHPYIIRRFEENARTKPFVSFRF